MNTMRKYESVKCFKTLLKYAFLLSKNGLSWERAVNYNPTTNVMVKESGTLFFSLTEFTAILEQIFVWIYHLEVLYKDSINMKNQ